MGDYRRWRRCLECGRDYRKKKTDAPGDDRCASCRAPVPVLCRVCNAARALLAGLCALCMISPTPNPQPA